MKKILLLSFLIFIGIDLFATHNEAGDITYKHISGNTYRITIRTFTNTCSTTADRCELLINSTSDSIIAPRRNGPSVICSGANHDGQMISVGCTAGCMQYNLYDTILTFPGPGNYTIWVEDPTRNMGICNLGSSGSSFFCLKAEIIINSFIGINNGPVYTATPVMCDSIGIPSYYNPLCNDVDGDSLEYDLIVPLDEGGYDVTGGWTYPQYSSTFTLNHGTGAIAWISPVVICNYIYDIKVTEWRNVGGTYIKVGSTMQEVWTTVSPYTGITENQHNPSLSVFQNPSSGSVNFTLENNFASKNYTLVITNALGQKVKTISFGERSSVELSDGELPSGIYFYSLADKTDMLNKGKFLISGGSSK